MFSYPYYKELNQTINYIYNHYINKENLTIDEIYEVIAFMDLWNNELSSILVEICEKANLSLYYSYEISDELYKTIIIRDSLSKYWYARELVMHVNYVAALDYYKELIVCYEKQENLQRKINVMTKIFGIYRDIDQQKALNYVSELDKILKNTLVSKKQKRTLVMQ